MPYIISGTSSTLDTDQHTWQLTASDLSISSVSANATHALRGGRPVLLGLAPGLTLNGVGVPGMVDLPSTAPSRASRCDAAEPDPYAFSVSK
jgi:hypothetical protein